MTHWREINRRSTAGDVCGLIILCLASVGAGFIFLIWLAGG